MRSPSARHAVWGRRGCYPEAECGLARVPAPLSLPPAPMDPRPRRAPTREQHRPRHRSLTRLLPNRKLGGSSADPRRTERTPTEPDADTRFQPAETPAGPETRAAGAGGRPYVSANPTLRGGRLRQDPESETGAGDLPDPVTTLVLLRNRLPLAAGGSSCFLRPRGQQIIIQRPSPTCLLLCIKFSWNRAVSLPCVVYGCPWTQLRS
ncbi:uncharacterized protein LOC134728846 isoform X2 [Pan paniscus]|uniref:uncharacterized protein LOC134728846 isoform X2 n=1 Tax=Pan paniscus TaxID=9597 RepID=UPI003003AA2A